MYDWNNRGDWLLVVWMMVIVLIGIWIRVRPRRKPVAELFYADIQCMALINWIRNRHEGWTLELWCDNPDFGGPECAIEVYGEWKGNPAGPWHFTEWRRRRFEGSSLSHCLQKAKAAMIVNDV